MPASDGIIRIKTAIDNRKAKVDLADLQRQADDCAKRIKDNNKKAAQAANDLAMATERANAAEARKAAALKKAKEAQAAYNKELEKYKQRAKEANPKWSDEMASKSAQESMNDFGGSATTRAKKAADEEFSKAAEEADKTAEALAKARAEGDSLEAEGAALQTRMLQLAQAVQQFPRPIEFAKAAAEMLGDAFRVAWVGAKKALGVAVTFGKKVLGVFQKAAGAISRYVNHLAQGTKLTRQLAGRTRRLLTSVLIFNYFSKAIQGMTEYIKQAVSQNEAFKSSLSNVKGAASQVAAGFSEIIAPALTAFMNQLAVILSYIAKLFSYFSGKKLNEIKSTAKAAGAAAKGTTTMGFDELNVLNDNNGGGAGDTSPNYDYEGHNPLLESMLAQIKAGDWGEAGNLLAAELNRILDGWNANAWGKKVGAKIQNGLDFVYNAITTFSWNRFGGKLVQAFNGIVEMLNPEEIGALLVLKWNLALRTLGGFLEQVDGTMLGQKITAMVKSMFDTITGAIQSVDWSLVGTNIKNMLANIDWQDLASALGTLIGSAFKAACDFFNGLGLYRWFAEQFKDGFFNGIINVFKKIGTWVYQNILLPFWNAFCSAFGIHSPSTVMMELGEYTMQGFIDGIVGLLQKLKDRCSEIKEAVVEKFTQLKTKVEELSTTLKDKASSTYEALKTTAIAKFTTLKEKVVSTVEGLKSTTETKFGTLKTNVSSKAEAIKTAVLDNFSAAKTKALEHAESLRSSALSKFNTIKKELKSASGEIKKAVAEKFKDMKTNVTDTVKGLKDKVKEIFTNLKDGLKTPINGVIGYLNSLCSGIVKALNNVIDKLNEISVTVPDWVPQYGGKKFGFNIDNIQAPSGIPLLAQGAVIPPNREFMAVLGDQTSGTNIEAPLETIKQALSEVMDSSTQSINLDISATLDGDVIYRNQQRVAARKGRRLSSNPIFV